MKLTPQHLQASYEIYMKYGNSSSATIISVLNKLREIEGKDQVVACAFGPGIALEMMILRRRKEVASPVDRSGRREANGVSHSDGADAHKTTVNGDNISDTNGTAKKTDDLSVESEHLGQAGVTTDDVASGGNSAHEATAKGSTGANGEEDGSAGSLLVEELD